MSFVSLNVIQEYEDQTHLQKEEEMVKFEEEKVETKENVLMHTST